MQDEPNNLVRNIPTDVQHLYDDDIGAGAGIVSKIVGGSIGRSKDLISRGQATLTNEFVNEPYSWDPAGVERADFLSHLFRALRHSRRLRAAQLIRSYKHLIDADRILVPGDSTKRNLEMTLNKPPSPATKSWFSPTVEILMVAAVVFGFLVFHIVCDEVFLPPAKADMVGSNNYGD